jgi:hypothetical protein
MASRWRGKTGCALAAILSVTCAQQAAAQQTADVQSAVQQNSDGNLQSANAALREMTQLAGVIFTGQVVGVRRVAGADGTTSVVEISFAVQDAVRGVSGTTYTVREWAGLWPAGDTPFVVGQRYLMLLHTPSAAGLSSPVGGMDGAIPIRGGPVAGTATANATAEEIAGIDMVGSAAVSSTTAGSTSGTSTADGRVVDLRWVGTRVSRPVVYREANAQAQTESTAGVNAGTGTGTSLQAAGYSSVIGMLRGWEKSNHAAQ